jgi:hypothetical protein
MARTEPISWPMTLAVFAIAVEFCVSANLLTWIGVPYVTDGGFLPEKIHPGTYLLCLAFVARVVNQVRPNDAFWQFLGGDGKLVMYFGSLAFCAVYMLLTTGSGNLIVLFDTFLPAGLLASVVCGASPRELRFLRSVFRFGICLNAIIALVEVATHATLVPLYLNKIEYQPTDGEFRPIALYDHPLTGGVMTLIGLAVAPCGRWWRLVYLFLCGAALIAFGGRVAGVAAVMSAVILAAVTFFGRALRRDRAAMTTLLYYGMTICACAATAMGCFAAGFGERLLRHLYWDQSAQVRVAQWKVFEDLTAWQIVFGTRRADLLALLSPLWLQSGVGVIENFWLLMFIGLGVVGFPIFIVAFSTLISWCWERTRLRGHVLLVSFVVVVSTSNSLGRKSTLLVGLIAATACLPEWRVRRNNRVSTLFLLPFDSILMRVDR